MTTKSFFVEVNLRGKKRITGCFYNPKTSLISSHLNEIEPKLDLLSSRYENFLSLGYFNAEPTTTTVSDFCEFYSLKNSKDVICLKNPCAPTCIVLMIKNQPRSFKHSMVIETGLSDFHSMCVTVMKTYYNKQKLHIVKYRNSKNFSSNVFLKDLKTLLSKFDNEKNIPFTSLKETVNRTHEMRANQTPFINKTLSKEIMKRSHLRNTFLNAKSEIDRRAYKISKIMKKNLFQVLLTLHL